MKINEIFYSLQGEGGLAGTPSVFIRIAGCPLRCGWCDTKYAWSDAAGTDYTIDELVRQARQYPTQYVVVTGGEPLACEETAELLTALKKADFHTTVETCGIFYVEDLACDLMSISPKLSNSRPAEPEHVQQHEQMRFRSEAIRKLVGNYDYQLKFVVNGPEDLDEIAACLGQLGELDPYSVFLMPQARSRAEYIEKSELVAEICKKTGFKMSQRLHVMLWDSKKGR